MNRWSGFRHSVYSMLSNAEFLKKIPDERESGDFRGCFNGIVLMEKTARKVPKNFDPGFRGLCRNSQKEFPKLRFSFTTFWYRLLATDPPGD